MYTISKEFHFSSAHILHGLSDGHPCGRLHGHNYIVIVELYSGELNDVGFIIDYNDLNPISEYIDNTLDHKFLNDVFDFQPSAENMAKFLFDKFKKDFKQLKSISVKETPKTCATYGI